MAVPQLVLDAIRFLLALAAPASLVALVLAGIALRREGTTSFSVGGGGFSKWMFWAIVMITLPQVFGWFAFWGVGAPLPGGGIGNGWMSGFANDAVIFVNTFVIGRLVPVLAAWMVLRSVIDWSEGYTPLASILGAMFLLAIPASAALLQSWNDGTRFGTATVLEGAWTYTASRIMPIAAGLAVIGAVVNFAFGRPAIRLIGSAAAFLTVSALWRLVVSMMEHSRQHELPYRHYEPDELDGQCYHADARRVVLRARRPPLRARAGAHLRPVGRLSLPDGLGRLARHREIRGPGRMEQPGLALDHASGNGELDVQRLS